jgi:carbon storage regulator
METRKRLPLAPWFMRYNSAVWFNTACSKEGSAMLVLSRKLGEKIYINDNICITVVDIDRGKIRLGIEAPREVPIFRQELLPGHEKGPQPAAVVVTK